MVTNTSVDFLEKRLTMCIARVTLEIIFLHNSQVMR